VKNKMLKQGLDIRTLGLVLILMFAGIVAGCAGSSEKSVIPPDESILRIGVSTNYPPLIFKQGEDIVGVEADLARELAAYLGKKPVFVEVTWADQIDQLMAGATDIIMAGMSVTEERLYRINFSKAYFKTGQMVLVANKPVLQHLDNFPALRAQVVSLRVGVVENTTGEIYVMENLHMARKVVRYKSSAAAIEALKGDKIHLFVHDGVRIFMLEAANQQYGFKKIPMFFTDEYLAWGVSKNNDALLTSANAFLDEIKGNGKLKKILSQWIPNIGDLK